MKYQPNPGIPDVSVPAFDPPVLDQPTYPVSKLECVHVIANAGEYAALMGGVQPPPFNEDFRFQYDPTVPLSAGGLTKSWLDTAPFASGMKPDEMVSYFYLKTVNSVPVMTEMRMTVAQAANYNMPNQHVFEPLVIPPTRAWFTEPNSGRPTGVDADFIIEEADALALAGEINRDCGFTGAAAITVVMGICPGLDSVTINWNGETRRPWNLRYSDTSTSNAMTEYIARNKAGIGTPGKFVVADAAHGGKPNWIADVDDTVAGTVPTPMRLPVTGKEEIIGGGLAATEVRRLDMFVPLPGFETYVAQQFSAVRAQLDRIEKAVTK